MMKAAAGAGAVVVIASVVASFGEKLRECPDEAFENFVPFNPSVFADSLNCQFVCEIPYMFDFGFACVEDKLVDKDYPPLKFRVSKNGAVVINSYQYSIKKPEWTYMRKFRQYIKELTGNQIDDDFDLSIIRWMESVRNNQKIMPNEIMANEIMPNEIMPNEIMPNEIMANVKEMAAYVKNQKTPAPSFEDMKSAKSKGDFEESKLTSINAEENLTPQTQEDKLKRLSGEESPTTSMTLTTSMTRTTSGVPMTRTTSVAPTTQTTSSGDGGGSSSSLNSYVAVGASVGVIALGGSGVLFWKVWKRRRNNVESCNVARAEGQDIDEAVDMGMFMMDDETTIEELASEYV